MILDENAPSKNSQIAQAKKTCDEMRLSPETKLIFYPRPSSSRSRKHSLDRKEQNFPCPGLFLRVCYRSVEFLENTSTIPSRSRTYCGIREGQVCKSFPSSSFFAFVWPPLRSQRGARPSIAFSRTSSLLRRAIAAPSKFLL